MSYYFSNDPNLESDIKQFETEINGTKFKFFTDNGVFSKSKLDFGTRTLLENLGEVNGDVLDLGCGYGPVGIYISKVHNINVDMIDINERALKLSEKNCDLNKVKNNVFLSEGYLNITKKYDYIVSNPPIRVGKDILYNLLFKAKDYLNANGKLIIVINKDQGAKSLVKDLEKEYLVTVVAKNKGFYIISAKIS